MLKPRYADTQAFYLAVGLFYINWSRIEMMVDFAVGEFLGISHKEAHVLTTYIDFGRKASWLRELVKDSDYPKKGDLLRPSTQSRMTANETSSRIRIYQAR